MLGLSFCGGLLLADGSMLLIALFLVVPSTLMSVWPGANHSFRFLFILCFFQHVFARCSWPCCWEYLLGFC